MALSSGSGNESSTVRSQRRYAGFRPTWPIMRCLLLPTRSTALGVTFANTAVIVNTADIFTLLSARAEAFAILVMQSPMGVATAGSTGVSTLSVRATISFTDGVHEGVAVHSSNARSFIAVAALYSPKRTKAGAIIRQTPV